MSAPESKFPSITDMRDVLSKLIDEGFGAMPVQILVAPDSTIQAIARHAGAKDDDKPALMVQFEPIADRIGASIISTARLEHSSKREAVQ